MHSVIEYHNSWKTKTVKENIFLILMICNIFIVLLVLLFFEEISPSKYFSFKSEMFFINILCCFDQLVW